MGVERQVPLRMREVGVEQVVQNVDEPLQVPQDGSQAARMVSDVPARTERRVLTDAGLVIGRRRRPSWASRETSTVEKIRPNETGRASQLPSCRRRTEVVDRSGSALRRERCRTHSSAPVDRRKERRTHHRTRP